MTNPSLTAREPARLRLQKGADRRLRSGHLWVYSNEVDTHATPLRDFAPGQQVSIEDALGRCLGTGYANPQSLICARLLTSGRESWGIGLLESRIRLALQLREQWLGAPFYRLIHGEGDLLPGLVVDRYGDHLTVQLNTAGMDRMQDIIMDALRRVLQPSSILLKNDSPVRSLEGLSLESVAALGAIPEHVHLEEHGVRFSAPLAGGQKTGWFYDQRANRAWIRRIAQQRRVLDVFSYVGSFGVQAAACGATEVLCVDSSAAALQQAKLNASLNGAGNRLTTLQGDAVEQLRALHADSRQFDVVVVDPPAYIKRRKDMPKGLAAYKRINTLAMQLVEKGGFMITCSCSMHLDEESLLDAVRGAAVRLQRECQLLAMGMQDIDHPVHPAIPETRYLKAALIRVL